MQMYEKHVNEFVLGQGYVAQKPVIMSEEEVRAEIEAQGGQKYQNVWYVEVAAEQSVHLTAFGASARAHIAHWLISLAYHILPNGGR